MPSATTVIDFLDGGKSGGFAWAAGMRTAQYLVHGTEWHGHGRDNCRPDLKSKGLCPMCQLATNAFRRYTDERKHIGTHVHHLLHEFMTDGTVADVEPEIQPYLAAFQQFLAWADPEPLMLEQTILYVKPSSHSYRGTFDLLARIDCPVCADGRRCKWLIDYKTGGFYEHEQTLQLAAYRGAQHLTSWEGGVERITGPMVGVGHAGVLLLNDAGLYDLKELSANGEAFAAFLRLRDIYGWCRKIEHARRRANREHLG
jgi:hypothetical protein